MYEYTHLYEITRVYSISLGLRYRNTTTLSIVKSVTNNMCLCFEQVASVKTLVMYKGLLENAMQMKN